MKKYIFIWCFSLFICEIAKAQQSNPDCPNGDVESGSFANWATYTGVSSNPQNMNSFTMTYNSSRAGVQCGAGSGSCSGFQLNPWPIMIQGGIDKYGNFALPNQGTYCFRLGNNGISSGSYNDGYQADLLRYTFVVTNNNKHFKFRYAVVFQDGGHPSGVNPEVLSYITLGNKIFPSSFGPFWINDFHLYAQTIRVQVADANNPYYKHSTYAGAQNVIYKDWQCIEYDLSQYVGQTVSFIFLARDCAQGGHFGYAYVDGLCTDWPAIANIKLNMTDFCDNGVPVILDASGSTGEDRWNLDIAECDASGNLISGGVDINEWFYGVQAPSNFDITQWYASKGKKFKCNSYYKVKVGVLNDCASLNEKSQIIHFRCPTAIAGADQNVCCPKEGIANDNPPCFSFGVPPDPSLSYSWTSFPVDFQSNHSQINPCPSVSTAYILTVTDHNGCKATDSVIVRFKPSALGLTITSPNASPTGCTACGADKILKAQYGFNPCTEDDPYFEANYPTLTPNSVSWIFYDPKTNTYSPIAHGDTYTPPNADGVVYTNVTDGCATALVKTVVKAYTPPSSFSYWAANAMDLSNPNPLISNLIIYDGSSNAPAYGIGPAYGASDFVLTVYDRWGNVIRTVSKVDVGLDNSSDCLKQGDVRWDGRDENGQDLPEGVYSFQLCMQFCPGAVTGFTQQTCGSGYKLVCAPNIADGAICCGDQHWVWWPPHYECGCDKPCVYSVTLLGHH
ncbi:MAG: hypothetical protein JST26_04800 [Bacteroidetes bacterium]|nr:hypothetical protein [Bacteroidota bacterium]